MWRRTVMVTLLAAGCGRLAFDVTATDVGVDDASSTAARDVFVQRRELTMATSPASVTVEPVDLARTMVLCDLRTLSSLVAFQPTCELTDDQTVTLTSGDPSPNMIVSVQVVQLPPGSRVQRGAFEMVSGLLSLVTQVAPFSRGAAFPIVTRWNGLDASTLDERFELRATLPTDTDLELRRTATGNNLNVAWQVVEIAEARVEHAEMVLGPTTTSMTSTPAAFDPGQTFVLGSNNTEVNVEEGYLVRQRVLDAGNGPQYEVARQAAIGTVEAAVHVVEVPGVLVEHGITSFVAETAISVPLARAVEPSRTMVILSSLGGRPGANADLDYIAVTGAVMPGELVLQRSGIVSVGTSVAWSVVTWP